MALLDWLPKTENGPAATATVATLATQRPNSGVADKLKGAAVLFVAEGAAGDIFCWIVADQQDADRLRRSGIQADDVVIDRQEVRELVAIGDSEIVAEILRFKHHLPGGRLHRRGGQG